MASPFNPAAGTFVDQLLAGQAPPSPKTRVPPDWQRWATAQKMIKGYQNNWNPNPIGTRLTENG